MSFDTQAARMAAVIAAGVGIAPYPNALVNTDAGYALSGIYHSEAGGGDETPPTPLPDFTTQPGGGGGRIPRGGVIHLIRWEQAQRRRRRR